MPPSTKIGDARTIRREEEATLISWWSPGEIFNPSGARHLFYSLFSYQNHTVSLECVMMKQTRRYFSGSHNYWFWYIQSLVRRITSSYELWWFSPIGLLCVITITIKGNSLSSSHCQRVHLHFEQILKEKYSVVSNDVKGKVKGIKNLKKRYN